MTVNTAAESAPEGSNINEDHWSLDNIFNEFSDEFNTQIDVNPGPHIDFNTSSISVSAAQQQGATEQIESLAYCLDRITNPSDARDSAPRHSQQLQDEVETWPLESKRILPLRDQDVDPRHGLADLHSLVKDPKEWPSQHHHLDTFLFPGLQGSDSLSFSETNIFASSEGWDVSTDFPERPTNSWPSVAPIHDSRSKDDIEESLTTVVHLCAPQEHKSTGSGRHKTQNTEKARNAHSQKWGGAVAGNAGSQCMSLGSFLAHLEKIEVLQLLRDKEPIHPEIKINGFDLVESKNGPSLFHRMIQIWFEEGSKGRQTVEQRCKDLLQSPPDKDMPKPGNSVWQVFRRAGFHPEKNVKRRGFNFNEGMHWTFDPEMHKRYRSKPATSANGDAKTPYDVIASQRPSFAAALSMARNPAADISDPSLKFEPSEPYQSPEPAWPVKPESHLSHPAPVSEAKFGTGRVTGTDEMHSKVFHPKKERKRPNESAGAAKSQQSEQPSSRMQPTTSEKTSSRNQPTKIQKRKVSRSTDSGLKRPTQNKVDRLHLLVEAAFGVERD